MLTRRAQNAYDNTLFLLDVFSCLKYCSIFTKYSGNLLLHRRSLDAVYYVKLVEKKIVSFVMEISRDPCQQWRRIVYINPLF